MPHRVRPAPPPRAGAVTAEASGLVRSVRPVGRPTDTVPLPTLQQRSRTMSRISVPLLWKSLARQLSRSPYRGRRGEGRGPARFVPGVLALEDRVTPSAFTVTNTDDSGPGSLRDAVQQANAQPGADTVRFAPGLHGS